MKAPYTPLTLPIDNFIDINSFKNELLQCKKNLDIYNDLLFNCSFNPYIFIDKNIYLHCKKHEGYIDLQEKLNQCETIKLGEYLLSKDSFSINMLQKLHDNLLKNNVRGSTFQNTYIREKQNYIVSSSSNKKIIVYIPPSPEKVKNYLANLIDYINEPNDTLDTLVRLAIINGQYELIHPFLDGNGRLGRTLIPLYLYYTKSTVTPTLCMDRVLNSDRKKYHHEYRNLTIFSSSTPYNNYNRNWKSDNLSISIGWGKWIKFFLQKLSEQLQIDIYIINNMNQLYKNTMFKISSYKERNILNTIVTFMFYNPVTTLEKLSYSLCIKDTIILKYLNILIREDIIYIKKGRVNNYILKGLFQILCY